MMKLSKKLMMLMTIFISLSLCTKGLTQNIQSDLTLNKPKIIEDKDNYNIAFTTEDYKIILQIYSSYHLLLELKQYNSISLNLFEQELFICSERLDLKDEAIWILRDDRNMIYDTLEILIKEQNSIKRRNNIKIVLFSSGSILVGIGLGLLIGVIAI